MTSPQDKHPRSHLLLHTKDVVIEMGYISIDAMWGIYIPTLTPRSTCACPG